MKIDKNETKIIGHWNFNGSKMIADDQCLRIDMLIKNYLVRVATDSSGWLTLYQDPNDCRYWELTYPDSEMQGGGPPLLILLSESEAKDKYNI